MELNNNKSTPALLQDIASQLPPEFKLLEFLGEGGHGIVLKALHLQLQQPVALKIIKTDDSEETKKQVERMQNEARTLAKLNHKNIVKVYQMGACIDSTPFLVCEYLEGVTLAQYLKTNPQPGPRTLLEIFRQILEALSIAHENGLLHRDVKPSNVVIMTDSESGTLQVKLVDFGIARDFETEAGKTLGLTRTIQVSGSAPYMSPEQCKGERIDQRSDLYSVGCMLYEFLTGEVPFRGETPMHTRYMQIHEQAKLPLNDKYAHTAGRAAVFKLTLQALSKDPEQRPVSAAVFRERLIEAMPAAFDRGDWSLAKKKQLKLAMTAALISFLLVFAFALFAVLQLSEESKEKHRRSFSITRSGNGQAGRSDAHLKPHSRMVRFKELKERLSNYSWARDYESTRKGIALLQELKESLLAVPPSESELRFAILREIARFERKLELRSDSETSWKEVLKLCKDPEGKETIEAIEANLILATLAKERDDWEKIGAYLNEAFRLLRKNDTELLPRLNIPSMIDEFDGDQQLVEVHALAAALAAHNHDLKMEAEEYKKAEAAEQTKNGIVSSTQYLLYYINARSKVAPEECLALLIEREKILETNGKEHPEYRIVHFLSQAGDTFSSLFGEKKLAYRSYQAALKILAKVENKNQEHLNFKTELEQKLKSLSI